MPIDTKSELMTKISLLELSEIKDDVAKARHLLQDIKQTILGVFKDAPDTVIDTVLNKLYAREAAINQHIVTHFSTTAKE